MALIQGWVGAVLIGAALVVAAAAWWVARRSVATTGRLPAANLDRVRALPAFRALVRHELLRRRIEVGCLALGLVGAALMGARLAGVSDDAEELRTREVVLCLDVSGSMREVDATVVDTYLQLVAQLDEERIGFVMFDGYAVTVFPLTSDKEYIAAQLEEAKQSFTEAGRIPGTTASELGSSLIGDGLATCVQRFDQLDTVRSRTIVLATDNELAGDAVYTTEQAGEIAREQGVMVFGVMPAEAEGPDAEELGRVAESTGGAILTVDPDDPTDVALISSTIKDQQKAALLTTSQERSFDLVWPGAWLFLLGLGGSLAASWTRGRQP